MIQTRLQLIWALTLAASLLPISIAQALTVNDGLTSTLTGLNLLQSNESLFVRNVGCVDDLPCPSPGGATQLTAINAAVERFIVDDTSTLITQGGFSSSFSFALGSSTLIWNSMITFGSLIARDDATIILIGGGIDDDVEAFDQSFIQVDGGSLGRDLWARQDATILVTGGTMRDRKSVV